MDLSKLSDADLTAMQSGDLSKVSDGALRVIAGEAPPLWQSALNGIPKGFAGTVDTLVNAPENVWNLSKMAFGTAATAAGRPDLAPEVTAPPERTKELLTKAGVIQPYAEPTTFPGRMVDMAGQAVGGGGVNPSAAARNLSRGSVLPVARDVIAALASGGGAAAGQELASKVDTGSESGNIALRTAAGMVGGTAPGALVAARGTAGDRTAAALKGVTPEQLALARALEERAATAGSPITGYEAIQAVTGLNPKMQTQQRIAEQSDAAAGNLTPMMQARPGRNTAMAENTFDQIAPRDATPDALGGLMQQGATDAITTAHRARSAEAGPLYKQQRASDAEAMALAERIPALAEKLADRTSSRDQVVQLTGKTQAYQNEMDRKASQYSPVPGYPTFPKRYTNQNDRAIEAGQMLPELDAIRQTRLQEMAAAEGALFKAQDALAAKNLPAVQAKVDSFLSDLDARIKLAGPTAEGKILKNFREEVAPGGDPILYPSQLESVYKANRNKTELSAIPTSEEKTIAGVIGPHVKALDSVIKDISPAIAEGRKKYAELSRDYVTPMEKGQIGKLTRSDEFPVQAGVLLPEKPMDVTPDVVGRTVRTIDAEAPGVPARFIGQYLRGTFNEANGGGIANNPMGGYQFAKKVADNPMQRANLVEALRAAGKDPLELTGALDVYQAQGFKPPVNSATAANFAEGTLMGGNKPLDLVTRPFSAAGKVADSWRNGWATKAMAEALASPGSVGRLEELARMNGAYSPMQQQILINLLLNRPKEDETPRVRVDGTSRDVRPGD